MGQNRAAVRVGVFHLLFNLISVLLFAWFAPQLAAAAVALTPGTGADAVARQIANAHVMFNVAGVLVMLPFVGMAARGLDRLIADKPGTARVAEGAVPQPA